MKNKAKCKLCSSIIESYHSTDYVMCKCGEIIVDGGESMKCGAKNWDNFLRVDDEGNEIIVKVEDLNDKDDVKPLYNENEKPSKKELIGMLDEMINNIEMLPDNAKLTGINHYDYCALMMLLSQILKSE